MGGPHAHVHSGSSFEDAPAATARAPPTTNSSSTRTDIVNGHVINHGASKMLGPLPAALRGWAPARRPAAAAAAVGGACLLLLLLLVRPTPPFPFFRRLCSGWAGQSQQLGPTGRRTDAAALAAENDQLRRCVCVSPPHAPLLAPHTNISLSLSVCVYLSVCVGSNLTRVVAQAAALYGAMDALAQRLDRLQYVPDEADADTATATGVHGKNMRRAARRQPGRAEPADGAPDAYPAEEDVEVGADTQMGTDESAAPQPALSAGLVHVGCYADSGGSRDLPHLMPLFLVDPVRCAHVCAERGHAYAGVQDGGECWCGAHYGGRGPSAACARACAAQPAVRCGGAFANDVYQARTCRSLSLSVCVYVCLYVGVHVYMIVGV
jgi:hypothetical protein